MTLLISEGSISRKLFCGLTWPGAPSCRHWEVNVCTWTLIWIWTWTWTLTWTSSCISSSSCLGLARGLWPRLLWSHHGRRTLHPCCDEQPGSPRWTDVSEGGQKVLTGNRQRPDGDTTIKQISAMISYLTM